MPTSGVLKKKTKLAEAAKIHSSIAITLFTLIASNWTCTFKLLVKTDLPVPNVSRYPIELRFY